MAEVKELKFPKYKDHLNKSFLEELSHKLWNTKGARFRANRRLLTKDSLSNKAIGFLSSYLIIFGLLSVYQISNDNFINEKIIAFGSTTLSILLLVFSQMEAAQDYKIRALAYHKCALEIGDLYNELRTFKTMSSATEQKKKDMCQSLSHKYQSILKEYPNHDDIDYNSFRAAHKDYYEVSTFFVFKVKIQYYLRTKLLYHVLIFFPFIALALIVLKDL